MPTTMPSCDAIRSKCAMRPALELMKRTHRLGSVVFDRTPEKFFSRPVSHVEPVRRNHRGPVAAVGDVHADLLSLLGTLHAMDLIDVHGSWTGGNTLLVQTGDILDRYGRGDTTRDTSHFALEELYVIQFLHGLGAAARRAGGDVLVLAGNHEVWAFHGHHDHGKGPTNTGWPGGRRKYFKPGTAVAKWWAKRCPVVAIVRNTIFMHGGAAVRADTNRSYAAWLRGDLPFPGKHVMEAVESRTMQQSCGDAVFRKIQSIAATFGLPPTEVYRMALGHVVQSRIVPCGREALWRLDVGSSEAFNINELLSGVIFPSDTTAVVVTAKGGNVKQKSYNRLGKSINK